MTSTPVAIGSRVPAWPTRRVPARRRILATTSWAVMPPPLSTITRPDSQCGRLALAPSVRWRSAESAVAGTRSSGIRSVVLVVLDLDLVLVVPVIGRLLVRIGVACPLGALARAGKLRVRLDGGGDQVVDPLDAVGQHVGDELERGC